jgi:hypothetical protein
MRRVADRPPTGYYPIEAGVDPCHDKGHIVTVPFSQDILPKRELPQVARCRSRGEGKSLARVGIVTLSEEVAMPTFEAQGRRLWAQLSSFFFFHACQATATSRANVTTQDGTERMKLIVEVLSFDSRRWFQGHASQILEVKHVASLWAGILARVELGSILYSFTESKRKPKNCGKPCRNTEAGDPGSWRKVTSRTTIKAGEATSKPCTVQSREEPNTTRPRESGLPNTPTRRGQTMRRDCVGLLPLASRTQVFNAEHRSSMDTETDYNRRL